MCQCTNYYIINHSTYNGLKCFDHMIYAQQTSMYQNIWKLMIRPFISLIPLFFFFLFFFLHAGHLTHFALEFCWQVQIEINVSKHADVTNVINTLYLAYAFTRMFCYRVKWKEYVFTKLLCHGIQLVFEPRVFLLLDWLPYWS